MLNDDTLTSFQRQILTSTLCSTSTLNIFCKGLDSRPIIKALEKIFSSPKLLLLRINCPTSAQITSEQHSQLDRQRLYLQGGVLSVTSRILLFDLLLDRLCASLISGIVVHDAHLVHENSIEAFILHLYRSKNKEGFIYAFSECPESFCNQFGRLEKAVKWLWTDEVQLWPRFHSVLQQELGQRELSVVQLKVSLSPLMEKTQFALLEVAEGLLKELKKTLGLEEEVLSIDHQATFRTNSSAGQKADQLREDLGTIRYFLRVLFAQDFGSFSEAVKQAFGQLKAESFLPMVQPQWNVFVAVLSAGQAAKDEVEVPRKFSLLANVLQKDIPDSVADTNVPFKVLVVVNDVKSQYLVAKFLSGGKMEKRATVPAELDKLVVTTGQKSTGKANLIKRMKLSSSIEQKEENPSQNRDSNASKTDELHSLPHSNSQSNQLSESQSNEFDDSFELDASQFEEFSLFNSSHIQIVTLADLQDIDLFTPNFIVLLDSNLQAIRRIEIFHNSPLGDCLQRVYLLIYANSLEERRHLEEVRAEKAAFERLINENSLLPRRRNLKESELSDDEASEDQKLEQNSLGSIIVDTRDLRSALPFVLYRAGFKVIPATIEVGDYILSMDICIERKSVPDLISSLQSGRLFTQLQSMTALYRRSILLIEFNQDFDSFNLRSYSNSFEIQSKLILLSIHFPQVAVIWSPTLDFTVKMFSSLKRESEEEPDVEKALAETFDERSGSSFFKEMLKNVQGVDEENVWGVMRKFESLVDFVQRATGKQAEFFEERRVV